MSDEREDVKPLDSGEVEVSVEGVQWTPPAIQVEPETPPFAPAPEVAITAPKKRGRVSRKNMTPEQLKTHVAAINKKHKEKERAAVKSDSEIKAKEAKAILMDERGLRNLHVIETCISLAQIAARELKIPFNRSLFTLGLQGVLAVRKKKDAPNFPEDVWNPGERLREHELYALWDYATSWRTQPDGTTLSFEEWNSYRRRCITDLIWFGNTVLGKDFQPEPHGRWAEELFPKLEPALMSLPEKFTQKDIAKAFYAISDVRQRCLIAARSSYKSTVSLVFLHQINLAFAGSVRCMIVSATQPLAKGFAANFRNTLTLRDPNNPTLMNQLWPEHCIGVDDGKTLEYTSPFRQLDMLIEPTVRSLSLITEGSAGGRYDYACYEDAAEISNSSTSEMRAKTQERVDMLRELGEPHSLTNYVGTPISAGSSTEDDPGDLYSVLLRREEINRKDGGEPKLLFTICPAWTVKPGVSKKAWDTTLLESEVDLLFPSRLTFKYLMGKLKECLATDSSAKVFRQQSLVSWVPDDESQVTVTFSEAALKARQRARSFFDATTLPGTPVYMAYDDSSSVSRYADFNAIAVVRAQPVVEELPETRRTNALVVLSVDFGRWKMSEKIDHLVKAIELHKVSAWALEKDRGHEELILGVRKMCMFKNIPMPHVILRDIKNTRSAKALKVKILEGPLEDRRLWFASGPWWDSLVTQFIRFDGVKKSGTTDGSKDDIPDAIATAYQVWGPRAEYEKVDPEEEEARRQENEEAAAIERRRLHYNRMFGSDYTPPPPKIEKAPQPVRPEDPRMKIFGNRGPWRL